MSVRPWERVGDMQSILGMMLSKGNLSSAVHQKYGLLVEKQRWSYKFVMVLAVAGQVQSNFCFF